MNIASVTVLFEPDDLVYYNIESYSKINKIIIVDNSVFGNEKLIIKLLSAFANKIIYINNKKNLGIAAALNKGIKIAIEQGYDFVLTMDQDSHFTEDNFNSYLKNASELNWDKIGIIGPSTNNDINKKEFYSKVSFLITSGSIINLKAFLRIGVFNENLFIDQVDHEYCLRLVVADFTILQFNNIILNHKLGQKKLIKLFFVFTIEITSHSPIRFYYFLRNSLYLIWNCKFPDIILKLFYFKIILKEVIKNLFIESNKRERFKYFFQAIRDFFSNKYGEFKID